jgi:hypothetical protein
MTAPAHPDERDDFGHDDDALAEWARRVRDP